MLDDEDLGGFTVGDWKGLREILKAQSSYSPDWSLAIDWYDERLKLRYFRPMRNIERFSRGEGFSLATIHCALIEHFAAIVQGKVFNPNLNSNSPSYEYKLSGDHFKEFIKTFSPFKDYFDSVNAHPPQFSANDFYANVRCALMHSACTKNNWRINTLSCGYSNPDHKILTNEGNGIKRLFRDILTEELEKFLQGYKSDLETSHKKRMYFARCLDKLCNLPQDSAQYPWWVDGL